MQASPSWTAPVGTLGGIVAEAYERAAALKSAEATLTAAAERAQPPRSLAAALRRPDVAVIAEVKRRSPSKGWINANISAVAQAAAYEQGGASAISVLTEPVHFGGSVEDLVSVLQSVSIPVLKKDFHVDPIQLLEAKALGASAALLIARALSPDALVQMTDAARALGLEVLVEIRDEIELERALAVNAEIIGINNRNLETLVIDRGTSERLVSVIPASIVVVAESGVSGRDDVIRVAKSGANAVLVGSSISAANDPVAATRDLTGVTRTEGARGR
ncbi:MAG: indole-3-glycerol phosphate synthase TrpC [Gemmatimonadaceae bacterium]